LRIEFVGRVYITNETGAQSECSELDAREMLRQGLISRRARYWKPGMAESRPVSELLEDADDDEGQSGETPGVFESIYSKIREWLRNLRR
jgi:hypothetical protein